MEKNFNWLFALFITMLMGADVLYVVEYHVASFILIGLSVIVFKILNNMYPDKNNNK